MIPFFFVESENQSFEIYRVLNLNELENRINNRIRMFQLQYYLRA